MCVTEVPSVEMVTFRRTTTSVAGDDRSGNASKYWHVAASASRGAATHVAAVSVPALHDESPLAAYPSSHTGWHVDPLRRELGQLPTPPFWGGVEASQGVIIVT